MDGNCVSDWGSNQPAAGGIGRVQLWVGRAGKTAPVGSQISTTSWKLKVCRNSTVHLWTLSVHCASVSNTLVLKFCTLRMHHRPAELHGIKLTKAFLPCISRCIVLSFSVTALLYLSVWQHCSICQYNSIAHCQYDSINLLYLSVWQHQLLCPYFPSSVSGYCCLLILCLCSLSIFYSSCYPAFQNQTLIRHTAIYHWILMEIPTSSQNITIPTFGTKCQLNILLRCPWLDHEDWWTPNFEWPLKECNQHVT